MEESTERFPEPRHARNDEEEWIFAPEAVFDELLETHPILDYLKDYKSESTS